jgi:hypothetical protein
MTESTPLPTKSGNRLFVITLAVVMASCSANRSIVVQQKLGPVVCRHYNGADATLLQVTDNYFPSGWLPFKSDVRRYGSSLAEFLAFKYNIPLHVFAYDIKNHELNEFSLTGRGGVSIYYPSCIAIYNKQKLDAKILEIGAITQRIPTTLSYGCGKTDYAVELPGYILGGRNSAYTAWDSGDTAATWYGENCGHAGRIDFSQTSNLRARPCSGRFFSDTQNNASPEQAAAFVEEQVRLAVESNGFYLNFMHWHDMSRRNNAAHGVPLMALLFESMAKGADNARIAKADYNQAVEYLYLKESIEYLSLKKIRRTAFLDIRLNKFREIDYTVINTPLTIRINKEKTRQLNYKKIIPGGQIRSIRQDEKYLYLNISIDMTKDEIRIPFTLSSGKKVHPSAWAMPVLTFDEASHKVYSSIPVKFVLFRRGIMAPEYAVELIDRTYKPANSFILPATEKDYRYFAGAITPEGESLVIELSFGNQGQTLQ